jgi:hypothetical protein
MNPLGVFLLVTCIIVVVSAPRHIAVLGMMAAAIFIPENQQLQIAGVNLFAMRFVELAGFIRVYSKQEFTYADINGFDRLFLFLFAYTMVVFLLRSNEEQAYRIGATADAYLCYFAFRGLIRTVGEFKQFLRRFVYLLGLFLVPLTIETLTARNPFEALGNFDPGDYFRHGRQRAFGSFQHPSLVGTLGASFVPLYIAYAFNKRDRKIAYLGIGLCLGIIWAANSGAPISCVMFGVVGWMFWKVRMSMRVVRRTIVVIIIVLDLGMKSSIWYLPAHLSDFTGGDGYHRSYLMDVAYQQLGKWAFAGMSLKETTDWFPTHLATGVADMTNEYVSFGLTAGLLSMLLFIAIFVKAFSNLGKAMAAVRASRGTPTEAEFYLWGLGVMLLIHAANLLSIRYYDQTYVMWYMQLALISTLSQRSITRPDEPDAADGGIPALAMPVRISNN